MDTLRGPRAGLINPQIVSFNCTWKGGEPTKRGMRSFAKK